MKNRETLLKNLDSGEEWSDEEERLRKKWGVFKEKGKTESGSSYGRCNAIFFFFIYLLICLFRRIY